MGTADQGFSVRLKTAVDKLSTVQLFIRFNIIFLLAVGILALIYAFNDIYKPIPLNIANIAPLYIAWIAVIAAFIVFFLCLRHKKQLINLGAFFVLFSLCELACFAFITSRVYTVPLRNHKLEESKKIIEMLQQANENPTAFRKGNYVLINMTLKLRVLHLQYRIADGIKDFDKGEPIKAPFREEACKYLSAYSQYDSLMRVAYTFVISPKNQPSFGFTPEDCAQPLPEQNVTVAPSSIAAPHQPQEMEDKQQNKTGQPKEPFVSAGLTAEEPVPDNPSFSGPVHDPSESLGRLQESVDKFQESLKLYTQELEQLEEKIASRASRPHTPASQAGGIASPSKSQ